MKMGKSTGKQSDGRSWEKCEKSERKKICLKRQRKVIICRGQAQTPFLVLREVLIIWTWKSPFVVWKERANSIPHFSPQTERRE